MSEINERLNEPDKVEIIRDQLAMIIADEMANQSALAIADDDPVAADYETIVFVENDEPLIYVDGENNYFPLINITLDRESRANKDASASVNYRKNKATYFIDCYATGNTDGAFAGRKATTKAWKLSRCVRAIIESDVYTYLLLRGVVSGHYIENRQAYAPEMQNSSTKVVVVRIELTVTYDQNAPITTGPGLELLPIKIEDESGQIVA